MTNRFGPALIVAIVAVAFWSSARSQTPGSDTGAPLASPVASPIASPAGRSVSVAGSVTIHLTDAGFDPVYVESTSGHDLTVTLVNSGTRTHGFRIDHYQIDVTLDPGGTTTVVIHHPDLGDFPFVSDAPGDGGLRGELTFYI